MIKKLLLISLILCLFGCRAIREVPIKEVEKIVYRDSTIYIKDTILIEVPKETSKEEINIKDTSKLETSLAESIAYIDTTENKLVHNLQNKPVELEKEVEYQTQIVIKEKIKEVEVPIEVPKPVTPKWCWILLVTVVGILGFKLKKFL